MTNPWLPANNLTAFTAIPVIPDDTLPAGAAILDFDPDEPRHITRVRTAGHHRDMQLTDAQTEQIRDHYRAMDERAGRLLAEWQQLAARFGFQEGARP